MRIRARPARQEPTMMKTVPSGREDVSRKGFPATCGMTTWYVGMLAVFWVSFGRVVVRLGRAAEEVSAGRAADDVEDVTFGRSVEETLSVALASVSDSVFDVCVASVVVVFASSLSCVAESVAPVSSSAVACGVCDVVVALASFFWAVT
jgi:hypothetical protein